MTAAVGEGRAAHLHPVDPHEPRGRMPDDPAKPPRFPYVAAALCAVCVGAAVWLPLRYWTVLDVTVPELNPLHPASDRRERHLGRYVRVR
ncbi:MAG: hypothetical protein ACYTFI_15035, partial [Planctomycetota bacterium]